MSQSEAHTVMEAKFPHSAGNQPLKIVNPSRPDKFKKRWGRIKANCEFSVEDQEKLKKYGSWFRALHNEKLAAKSEIERYFVGVCRREAAPANDLETIWQRYIHSRLVETQLRRLHRKQVDYASVRCSMEQYSTKGNPFDSKWLADEGGWVDEPSDGYSNRLWVEGATWTVVKIVRG